MSNIISITSLRKNLYDIVRIVTENGVQVTVNSKEGTFLMLSEAKYHGILETLYLSSDSAMKQSINDGLQTPLEDTIPEDKIMW